MFLLNLVKYVLVKYVLVKYVYKLLTVYA